jgi:hypothetical protein
LFSIAIFLKTKRKELGLEAIAQIVEHLPCKHEALNSNPSTTKKKKKGRFGNSDCSLRTN